MMWGTLHTNGKLEKQGCLFAKNFCQERELARRNCRGKKKTELKGKNVEKLR